MTDDLFLWTLYNSPSDFPGLFLARKGSLLHGQTDEFVTGKTAQEVQKLVQEKTPYVITFVPRHHTDDPVIVGVWL